ADRAADADPSRIVIVDIEARRLLDQLAVPLAPLGVDEDFDATYLEPEQFRVPLGNAESSQDDLPPELEDVLPELRRTYVPPGPGEGAAFQEYGAILPDGYEPKLVEHDTQTLIVERSRSLTDALALEPADDLQRGDHYRVAALSPFATERQLRAASTEYPSDVRDAYLALPDDFPDTVRQLATQLTAGTSSPYDAALAIETYLRSIPYDESIGRPPPDVDRIEYFLFELQRGYFDYHASAMTVMLRAIGVPARLATGYALTEIDESGRYVLRERHTYSWPEVYFPGFGWIAFNPTPNLPTVPRAPGAADAATGVEPVEGGGNFGFDSLDLDALQDLGPIDVDTPEGGISTDASSNGGGFPWLWLAAGAGAAIAIAGLARLAWERPFAGLPYPAKLWGKTQLLATLAGIGPQPDQTPREFAREAQAKIDGLAQLESLALVYERSRYGIREPNDDERTQLARDYRRVRNRLLARVVRWRWTPKGEEEEM
ncbi:MAG TPA: transglutaminase domain-containing protein, partial [Dehalococcoidia bacterium]|nr:transglutaminase domain-containing protein [Dehalococcoidia bacterium]